MKKSEFRTLLEEKVFIHTGSVNELAIESALSKTVRHMRNTMGGTEWGIDQLGNAECFYNEYGKDKTTFNQSMYRGRNSGTSRY